MCENVVIGGANFDKLPFLKKKTFWAYIYVIFYKGSWFHFCFSLLPSAVLFK
jgi:hypothetical protein